MPQKCFYPWKTKCFSRSIDLVSSKYFSFATFFLSNELFHLYQPFFKFLPLFSAILSTPSYKTEKTLQTPCLLIVFIASVGLELPVCLCWFHRKFYFCPLTKDFSWATFCLSRRRFWANVTIIICLAKFSSCYKLYAKRPITCSGAPYFK